MSKTLLNIVLVMVIVILVPIFILTLVTCTACAGAVGLGAVTPALAESRQQAQRDLVKEYGSRETAIAMAMDEIRNRKAPKNVTFPSDYTINHTRGVGESVHSVVGEVEETRGRQIITTGWLVQIEFTPPDYYEVSYVDFGEEKVRDTRLHSRSRAPVPEATEEAVTPSAFEIFEVAFDELNLRVRVAAGAALFTDASDGGNGRVYVDATDTWMGASVKARRSNLDTVYNLWKIAQQDNPGPIEVWVRDPKGRIVMRKP